MEQLQGRWIAQIVQKTSGLLDVEALEQKEYG